MIEPPTDRLDRIKRDYGHPGSWALMSEVDIAWLIGRVNPLSPWPGLVLRNLEFLAASWEQLANQAGDRANEAGKDGDLRGEERLSERANAFWQSAEDLRAVTAAYSQGNPQDGKGQYARDEGISP